MKCETCYSSYCLSGGAVRCLNDLVDNVGRDDCQHYQSTEVKPLYELYELGGHCLICGEEVPASRMDTHAVICDGCKKAIIRLKAQQQAEDNKAEQEKLKTTCRMCGGQLAWTYTDSYVTAVSKRILKCQKCGAEVVTIYK